MGTNLGNILSKMKMSGYKIHKYDEYFVAMKPDNTMKVILPRRDDVWISDTLNGVTRLSDGKLLVMKDNGYLIIDPLTGFESTKYKRMEDRVTWKGRDYLVVGLNKGLGVIDTSDNSIVNTMYTFINFNKMSEETCIIIASKLEMNPENKLAQRDTFYDLKGNVLGITKALMGRPYVIIGEHVYVEGTDIIYDINGVMKNGGNR